MTDDTAALQAKLTELHKQLHNAHELSPQTRAMLLEIVADIERVLTGERTTNESIGNRLNDVVSDFDGKHPTIAGTVGSIIDALSRMGI